MERCLFRGERTNRLVCVYWHASWCRKCLVLRPRLEKLLKRKFQETSIFADIECLAAEYRCDENARSLKEACGVKDYPTVQVWNNRMLVGERGADTTSTIDEIMSDIAGLLTACAERGEESDMLRPTGVGASRDDLAHQVREGRVKKLLFFWKRREPLQISPDDHEVICLDLQEQRVGAT
mmetsp:Transcript_27617/g.53922  ORF Transcript_27617/g.53922 Transcript_27617/m.53922 type:complete len:180 (+) Transcript_27617:224-763(+)